MVVSLLFVFAAHAGTGYYHPSDVSADSTLFAKAQEVAGVTFQQRSETAMALAGAIRHYEEALDLLGEAATEAERARHHEIAARYNREFAILQAFTNEQLDGFEAAFVGALQRALIDQDALECRPTQARSGPRLSPRFGGGGTDPVTCDGDDLNAVLASQMDQDIQLQADLDAILGSEWPALTIDAQPQPNYPPTATQFMPIRDFMRHGAATALDAIEEADEDARLTFQAAIEEGATPEDLASWRAQGIAITDETAARRAALAADVCAAADKYWTRLEKKSARVGWCAQPAMLGGCQGTAATQSTFDATVQYGAVRKALARANQTPR
jgi:hypothetical protein